MGKPAWVQIPQLSETFFHYYSKSYTNKKAENKDDNKGIKLVNHLTSTGEGVSVLTSPYLSAVALHKAKPKG